jgi:hypothetical protein
LAESLLTGLLWRKTPKEMSELSLDEYILMLGTQLWLKESIFNFIESLLGVANDSDSSTKSNIDSNSDSLNSLLKMTEELEGKTVTKNKTKVSKLDNSKLDDSLKDDLLKIRENFKNALNKKEDNEKEVDLSNVSLLINDNGARRDEKTESLLDKLKHYKKAGYIK